MNNEENIAHIVIYRAAIAVKNEIEKVHCYTNWYLSLFTTLVIVAYKKEY